MATVKDRILKRLKRAGRPLDDGELADILGVSRPAVNQAARQLEAARRIVRYPGPDGRLVNAPKSMRSRRTAREAITQAVAERARPDSDSKITEDEVKGAVKAHLEASTSKP